MNLARSGNPRGPEETGEITPQVGRAGIAEETQEHELSRMLRRILPARGLAFLKDTNQRHEMLNELNRGEVRANLLV